MPALQEKHIFCIVFNRVELKVSTPRLFGKVQNSLVQSYEVLRKLMKETKLLRGARGRL